VTKSVRWLTISLPPPGRATREGGAALIEAIQPAALPARESSSMVPKDGDRITLETAQLGGQAKLQ
jgi:hypothetical protein